MPLVPSSSSRHTSTSIPLWFQSSSRPKKSALAVSASPTSSSSETSDSDRRSTSSNPQQPQRPRGSFNSDRRGPPRGDFRGGGGRGRGGGRGGGGRGRGPPQQQQGPVLKLQNPLTINRMVDQTPADTDQELYAERRPPRNDNGDNNNNNQQRGRGPPRGGGPVASTDAGGRVTSEST